ncbi:MAG: hypothetical protein JJU02_00710 [Cryomorphaceae bacterium]|nr:hypothetical protein [Cryomorphaceae bacterium]
MRRVYATIIILMLFPTFVWSQFMPIQNDDEYRVFLDISSTIKDNPVVEIVPPLQSLRMDSAIYCMARIIPGTYSISNFGQFVEDISGEDQFGKPLEVVKLDANRWYFPQKNDLYKIKYTVKPTFGNSDIFEPAGTTFRDDVALLNLFAMVGYMQDNGQLAYDLTIQKPKNLYGAGNLQNVSRDVDRDQFTAPNYFHLHDNPLMYAAPDTVSVQVDDTRIHLALYSADGENKANQILPLLEDLFQATSDYFDGSLPVTDYHILLFMESQDRETENFGALEHHYSTVVYLPDYPLNFIGQNIKDIVAHEFLHIVTPLNFHSEVVHNFDFQYPKMTKHLWLYEGVTEYTSHLVQVRGGLITPEEFLETMREKMRGAEDFNPLVPMTTASKYALDVHEDQYLNVYQNGALVAMCIDLHIIIASNGKTDLKDLMVSLGNTFGPDTFFMDYQLFDIIADHGFPQIHQFAANHIEASIKMPFDELLAMVGYAYAEDAEVPGISFGNTDFGIDMADAVLVVESMEGADEMALALGFKPGDKLISLNGNSMELPQLERTLSQFYRETSVGQEVEIKVNRPNKKRTKYKTKTLKAKAVEVKRSAKHLIKEIEANKDQIRLREKWLNSNS